MQIAIQASAKGKIIARETLKAYRKDVTSKLVSAKYLYLDHFNTNYKLIVFI